MLNWRDRIRERRQRPIEPVDFTSGTLILAILMGLTAVFLVVYPALNSFLIGYREPLAATVVLAFSLALPAGVVVGYALLRPLRPIMARGLPIPGRDLLLRGFLDLFIFGLVLWAFLWTTQPPFGDFPRDPVIQDLNQVLFAVFVGYLLGANAVRAAFGLWWFRSRKPAAPAGRAPIGR